MSNTIVADFTAFLSVTVDDSPLFEAEDGRVVVTHEDVVISDGEQEHRLPIGALTNFDFRTVPEDWEEFFDDLVGVKFVGNGQATTVTIGTDTEVADRFVTVLLKLLLEDTFAGVSQQISGGGPAEPITGKTPISFLPQREYVRFDDLGARPIDISSVINVVPDEDGSGVTVHHTSEGGLITTRITPKSRRRGKFLRTYLTFRSELIEGAGPVRFIFVGDDRDKLVLIAKILEHRDIAYEAGYASSYDDVFEVLEARDSNTDCIVSEYELPNETGVALHRTLREEGYDAPMVFVTEEDPEEVSMVDTEDIVDVIQIGLRTEHYEDVVDAIQQATVLARSE